MKEIYDPEKIELHVQKHWEKKQTFRAKNKSKRKKYYCLAMLPYPSGSLHMGHVRNYVISDVIARFYRLFGRNVLHPIGWDAFGLPAENAAIEKNLQPSTWTYKNIDFMREQLKRLGMSYDWKREIITCKPEYYCWEQRFFIYLYKKGLVYRKKSVVNWCPKDQTVLANEQVIEGKCWRCDSKTEYRNIPQWFLKITDYAEELLVGLKNLDGWPKKVKNIQKNWIGKSEGAEITFQVINSKRKIKIYTVRPDLLPDVTYILLSETHHISTEIIANKELKNDFFDRNNLSILKNGKIGNKEKIGIYTGLNAKNPITGDILPVWIVNFALKENCSSSLGMPKHDYQDLEFAKKYNLLISPSKIFQRGKIPVSLKKFQSDNMIKLYCSDEFSSLDLKKKIDISIHILEMIGIGKKKINYRIKDWNISRQRYWGTPIPMVTLENGKIVPTSYKDVPVLPEHIKSINYKNLMRKNDEWIQTTYKGKPAFRETDTFDTFMESSWYYARYTCPTYSLGMLNKKLVDYWLPVDQYIGGIEHATMHLIYFRFYHKLLKDAGLVESEEPVKRLLCHGMVLSDAFYTISETGEKIWIAPEEVKIEKNKYGLTQVTDSTGRKLKCIKMTKMSKSKKNGINPDSIIKKYGADSLRLFIMFSSPPETPMEWKNSGLEGSNRFLKKVWKLVYRQNTFYNKKEKLDNLHLNMIQRKIRHELHKTIIKVTEDIKNKQTFNTAISSIMILINRLYLFQPKTNQDFSVMQESLISVVKMLYPFVPHICFVMWKFLGEKIDIDKSSWPEVDKQAILDTFEKIFLIQINGKFKSKITVHKEIKKEELLKIAFKEPRIVRFLKGKVVKKTIFIDSHSILNIIL